MLVVEEKNLLLSIASVPSKLKAKHVKKETSDSLSKVAVPKNMIMIFLFPPRKNAFNLSIREHIFLKSLSKVLTLPWMTWQTKN